MVAGLIPGADIARRILGPTADRIGEDLAKLYEAGRDRVIAAAVRKTPDLDDGKCANLRVARDVLWHGAFTDSEFCSEYYGGLLAASRSEDGKDDTAIPFVSAIKSMSSMQIRTHHDIYWAFEKLLLSRKDKGEKFDLFELVAGEEIYLRSARNTAIDLQVLMQQGLVTAWQTGTTKLKGADEGHSLALPYLMARPTVFGVTLYAGAHNQLEWWQAFGLRDFGTLHDVEPPKLYGGSLDELIAATGCEPV